MRQTGYYAGLPLNIWIYVRGCGILLQCYNICVQPAHSIMDLSFAILNSIHYGSWYCNPAALSITHVKEKKTPPEGGWEQSSHTLQ